MAQTMGGYLAALVLGYALGSIPFGLLLTRFAGTADIRAIGSGSIGATNVLRTGRKGLAAATLLCDVLKGTAAVALAASLFGRDRTARGADGSPRHAGRRRTISLLVGTTLAPPSPPPVRNVLRSGSMSRLVVL